MIIFTSKVQILKEKFSFMPVALIIFSLFFSACSIHRKQIVISEDGINLWLNESNSYFYKGKYTRTYFAFTNSKGQVIIKYYDYDAKKISKGKIIYSFSNCDDHASPSILVIENGKKKGQIAMTFSHHSSPLFFSITEEPENIDTFSKPRLILDKPTTYPALIQNQNGYLKIFYRGHPKSKPSSKGLLQSISSKNQGVKWSRPYTIIEFDENEYIYASAPYSKKNEIGISWSIFNTKTKSYSNLYFSKSLDFGKTWLTNFGYSNTLNKSNSKKLLTSSQIRVIDITKREYNHQYLISAVNYTQEFTCCNQKAKGIILSEKKQKIEFETKIDYYAAGANFDFINPSIIYFPKLNNSGGNDIYIGTINNDFELVESKLISGGKEILTRPSSTHNVIKNNPFTFLKIKKYESYNNFVSKVMWYYK